MGTSTDEECEIHDHRRSEIDSFCTCPVIVEKLRKRIMELKAIIHGMGKPHQEIASEKRCYDCGCKSHPNEHCNTCGCSR